MVTGIFRWPYWPAVVSFLSAKILSESLPSWSVVFLIGFGLCQLFYTFYRSLCVSQIQLIETINFVLKSLFYFSEKVSFQGRAVLVTGCDTGFGHSLAKKLHGMKLIVFAGCLNASSDGANQLKAIGEESGRLHVVQMDVTDQQTVDDARRYVDNHLPKDGLWGVVNNAGYARSGYLEWVSMDDYETVT